MATPKELRRLANELVARSSSIDERSYAVIHSLRDAADEIDRLTERLAEIDAGAQADEDDLNKMRDGTKLTRAGVVRIIVYQQQEIRELKRQLSIDASQCRTGEVR